MYRGVNANDLPAKQALAYNEHRDEYLDWQKQLWQKAASELFGDD